MGRRHKRPRLRYWIFCRNDEEEEEEEEAEEEEAEEEEEEEEEASPRRPFYNDLNFTCENQKDT